MARRGSSGGSRRSSSGGYSSSRSRSYGSGYSSSYSYDSAETVEPRSYSSAETTTQDITSITTRNPSEYKTRESLPRLDDKSVGIIYTDAAYLKSLSRRKAAAPPAPKNNDLAAPAVVTPLPVTKAAPPPKPTPAPAPAPVKTPTAASHHTSSPMVLPPKSPPAGIGLMPLLLALIFCGGAGFWFWRNYQRNNRED